MSHMKMNAILAGHALYIFRETGYDHHVFVVIYPL